MTKIVKGKGQYWNVVKEHATTYEICAVGGGFVYKVLKAELEPVKGIPDVEIECFALIDASEDRYPCRANPFKRWNGWADPTFDYKTMKKIIVEAKVVDETSECITFSFDDDQEPMQAFAINGRWSFNGWCWDIQDAKGRHIHSDGTVEQEEDED